MTVEKMIGGYTRREWLTYLGIATADDPKLAGIAGLSFTGNALKVLRVNATENGWEFSTTTAYTDEQAQDAVGGILTDTATIDFTYNDGVNTITADVKDASITLAKQANVATATVFYRKTAGTGAPEVQTLATLKTDLGLSGTNTGDQTSVSGNAGTATALQTSRNIDGQSFNGTADIAVIAPGTHAATSKTTPVDADELPLVDSAASNVLKKLTWANLKATLKTYFDTLYQPLSGALTTLAGLASTTDNFIVGVAGAWASRTPAQVRTALGLVIGTNVQAWDADLDAVASSGLAAAWTAYTPTITANTGAFTTVSATGRYKQVGKTVFVEIDISITTNGTAGTGVYAALPATAAAANFVLNGRELLVAQKALQGHIFSGDPGKVFIVNYDNTYPGANGYRLVVNGVYEAA